MSKKRRIPEGGVAATTLLRGFIYACSRGDHESLVRIRFSEHVPVFLVLLQQKVRIGGVNPVKCCQLLRNEVGDLPDIGAFYDNSKIVTAGNQRDRTDFRVKVDALCYIIKARSAFRSY